MMNLLNQDVLLSNGIKMPKLGFGTWELPPGTPTQDAVKTALRAGYKHLDTALVYQNEKDVGEAIKIHGIDPNEIFITAKLPPHIKRRNGVFRMHAKTLTNLNVTSVDLYLINAPRPFGVYTGDYDDANAVAWEALETLYQEGKAKAIGVSNFTIDDLENLRNRGLSTPHVNQIAYFVGHTQDALVAYCQKYNIQLMAYSPLARGYLLNNSILIDIAKSLNVTPAQVALRYIVQKGIVPIPKAATPKYIDTNTQLDFTLDASTMARLDTIENDPREWD